MNLTLDTLSPELRHVIETNNLRLVADWRHWLLAPPATYKK